MALPRADRTGLAEGAGSWPAWLFLYSARGPPQRLSVTFDGDNLHIAAPDLHFLTGKRAEPREERRYGRRSFRKLTLFSDDRGDDFQAPCASAWW